MSNNINDTRARKTIAPSHALLSAALGGLLCLGTACGSSNKTNPGPASAGSGGASTGGSGGASTGGSGGASTGGSSGAGGATDGGADASSDAATDAASDASDAAAYVYCSNAPVDVRTVTSQMTVAMTEAEFQTLCSSNGGTFEIMPHCGGFNSCMGLSYDIGTQVLSQHTCQGLNTCAGYSCVICNGDAGTSDAGSS